MGHPLTLLFIFANKTVNFSGIRTRVVRDEGERSDHWTASTAQTGMLVFNTGSKAGDIRT